MDFLNLAAQRYSVRKFTHKPVGQEALGQILKAGYLAPTACNLQPQRILVINQQESLEKLRRCTPCHFDAPAALLVYYAKDACWKRKYDGKHSGDIDASIVTTHMMLEAQELGIGTTWVMYFDPGKIKAEFGVPDTMEPVALLVMGYPAPDAKPFPGHSEFKPMDQLVFYNEF